MLMILAFGCDEMYIVPKYFPCIFAIVYKFSGRRAKMFDNVL